MTFIIELIFSIRLIRMIDLIRENHEKDTLPD